MSLTDIYNLPIFDLIQMNKTLIRILHKIGLIKHFNLMGSKTINQNTYKIPVLGKVGYHNLFDWEPWMSTLMQSMDLATDALFVDVGVNIGQSLLKIKSIYPEIRYQGFEPNPTCNNYLDLLINKNNLKNTTVLPVGIAAHNHAVELSLYNDLASDGAASIIKDIRPGNKVFGKKYVPVFNLKTIKESVDFDQLAILKIDVEGAEYEVLAEFENEIARNKPFILIEILPVYNAEMKDRLERQQKIESLISKLDYLMFKIEYQAGKLSAIRSIDQIGINSDINQCDYLFIHISKMNGIKQKLKTWLS